MRAIKKGWGPDVDTLPGVGDDNEIKDYDDGEWEWDGTIEGEELLEE